jgi:hypothetical protein
MGDSPRFCLEPPIRAFLAPKLRQDGYAGSGLTFRRVRSEWIQVVNVQGSRYGGQFAVNLAVHPIAIPDVRGELPDPKTITVELCEFRRRLSAAGADQWWAYEKSLDAIDSAMRDATDVYERHGRPLMDLISSSTSPLLTVKPIDFQGGHFDFLGFGSMKARMALVLARMRKSAGRSDDALAFAKVGLEACGDSAQMLRRDLQAIG